MVEPCRSAVLFGNRLYGGQPDTASVSVSREIASAFLSYLAAERVHGDDIKAGSVVYPDGKLDIPFLCFRACCHGVVKDIADSYAKIGVADLYILGQIYLPVSWYNKRNERR